MFQFFHKGRVNNGIYSPIKGKCIDIVDVNDETFSSKMLGDGVAIIPEDDVIKAPCDGKISMIFKTKHAIGIKGDNGMDILVHIGIDTVNEQGKGFKVLKKENSRIKAGESLLYIDLENLKKKYDMTIIIVITNIVPIEKICINKNVDSQTCILKGKDEHL